MLVVLVTQVRQFWITIYFQTEERRMLMTVRTRTVANLLGIVTRSVELPMVNQWSRMIRLGLEI